MKAVSPVVPNLLARKFRDTAPNLNWLTDISFVRTGQGWLYLSIVLELCARPVVGLVIEPYLTDRLTLKSSRWL
jgi:putative transposase